MFYCRPHTLFSHEATLQVNTGFRLWANISYACTMVLSRIFSSFYISAQYKYGVLKVYSSSSFCFLFPLQYDLLLFLDKRKVVVLINFCLMDHYVQTTNNILFLLINQMKYTAIIRSDGYIKCFIHGLDVSFRFQHSSSRFTHVNMKLKKQKKSLPFSIKVLSSLLILPNLESLCLCTWIHGFWCCTWNICQICLLRQMSTKFFYLLGWTLEIIVACGLQLPETWIVSMLSLE